MDDLIAWLRACLDDDERVARQVMAEPGGFYLEAETDDTNVMTIGAHVYRWTPKRVLDEMDAKRRILDLHEHVPAAPWGRTDVTEIGCTICAYRQDDVIGKGWCQTVRLLALPYADREGYRDEWKP
jgi:hypothetical protein